MPAGQQRRLALRQGPDGARRRGARGPSWCWRARATAAGWAGGVRSAWNVVPTGCSPASASAAWAADVSSDRDAGARRDACRLDLGDHAAGADRRGARPRRCRAPRGRPRRATSGTSGRPRVAGSPSYRPSTSDSSTSRSAWTRCDDQRREPVVVAEADLARGHGVVLVDDRDDAELEQPGEGLVRVAVVAAPGDVVDGQQHLADDEAVAREPLGVAGDRARPARRWPRPAGSRRSRGRRSRPSGPRPAAMAPELTRTTSSPRATRTGQRVDERVDAVDRRGHRRPSSATTSRP